MAQSKLLHTDLMDPLSREETWHLSEEIRVVNSLREDLARAMQARASQTLKLKALVESQHGSLALIEQQMTTAGDQLSQSSTVLQDSRLLVEKLAASSFHLQRTRGIFSRQLGSSKELLSEHVTHVEQVKQRVKPYKEESVKLAQQAEAARNAMRDILRIHEEEMTQQTQLKVYGDEIQKLEEEKNKLEPKLCKMQADIAAGAQAYKGQQSQSREQLEELRSLKNEQKELKNKEELLKVELEKLHQQKKEFEVTMMKEREQATEILEHLNEKLIAAKKEEQTLLEVVREKEQKLEEICDSRKQVDGEMAAATERMYSSIARMNQLRERDTEITKKRSALETALQQKQQELTKLKAQSGIIGESQRATEEIAKLKIQIFNLESSIQQKETEEKQLQQDLETAEREVLVQQTEYESLLRDETLQVAELDARRIEASALASDIAQLSCRAERFRTLQQQLKATEEAIVSENAKVEELNKSLTQKSAALAKLEGNKETVCIEHRRLEECLAMLRAEINSSREESACLHESLVTAKKELEAAGAIDESADPVGKREADLEADLDVFKKQLETQYQAAVEGIRCELKARYESILTRSIENERERLETQFHQEEAAVEAELKRLERAYEGKKQELAELEKKLDESKGKEEEASVDTAGRK